MNRIKELQPVDSHNFPPEILNFLHYANGIFKYGIICTNRAKALGITQVSSLDKQPRDPDEVEVNCVQKVEGIRITIYHKAKGAFTIATERRNDDFLMGHVGTKEFQTSLPGIKIKMAIVENPEALRILTERVHHSMLIVADLKKLKYRDNQGNFVAPNTALVTAFQSRCEIIAGDGCLEFNVPSNLDPSSFRAVLIPKQFEKFTRYLAFSTGLQVEYVETAQPSAEHPTFYGYRGGNVMQTAKVSIPHPDFLSALKRIEETLRKEGDTLITHVTKGPCKYDLKH